jgi:hypothetical protein
MSILSRGPSKDAFYQISVHLVSGLTGEDQPIFVSDWLISKNLLL